MELTDQEFADSVRSQLITHMHNARGRNHDLRKDLAKLTDLLEATKTQLDAQRLFTNEWMLKAANWERECNERACELRKIYDLSWWKRIFGWGK